MRVVEVDKQREVEALMRARIKDARTFVEALPRGGMRVYVPGSVAQVVWSKGLVDANVKRGRPWQVAAFALWQAAAPPVVSGVDGPEIVAMLVEQLRRARVHGYLSRVAYRRARYLVRVAGRRSS